MDRMLIILLCSLLIVHEGIAIRCYTCASSTLKACGDSFSLTTPEALHCDGTCVKRRGKQDRSVEVTRGCVTQTDDKCYTGTYNGISVYICTCNSDYCNHAERHQMTISALVFPLFSVIWILIGWM